MPPLEKVIGFETYMDCFKSKIGRPKDQRTVNIDDKYVRAIDKDAWQFFSALDNDLGAIDTGLEAALALYYSPGVVAIRPVEADAILPQDNPKQADLKFGEAVFREIQTLRFLGNTASMGRYEGMLKWITDGGNITRAEVEAYYRNNIRGFISEIVDEEFKGIKIPASTISLIKQTITDFYLTTVQATKTVNYNNIIRIDIALKEFPEMYGAYLFNNSIIEYARKEKWDDIITKGLKQKTEFETELQPYINTLKTPTLSIMGGQDISWDNAYQAYKNIQMSLFPEIMRKDIQIRNLRR